MNQKQRQAWLKLYTSAVCTASAETLEALSEFKCAVELGMINVKRKKARVVAKAALQVVRKEMKLHDMCFRSWYYQSTLEDMERVLL